MSTSLSVILRRFAFLALFAAVVIAILMIFSYDVIKIDWPSFMEISPARKQMEDPLPVPAQSIPVEGPATIPNLGAPKNPVAADATSLARGSELFNINCTACHGADGKGNGPVAAFLRNKKPIDLTGPIGISLSDGAIFTTISNGTPGGMPPLNENLTVRERWDVVNFVRQLQEKK
ncbi:MAG TPA: cytochrome c [Anaerolineales bacterium]|nr:cytochrome c [Anaerolineales bacterium]